MWLIMNYELRKAPSFVFIELTRNGSILKVGFYCNDIEVGLLSEWQKDKNEKRQKGRKRF